jgi:hypothetical protein
MRHPERAKEAEAARLKAEHDAAMGDQVGVRSRAMEEQEMRASAEAARQREAHMRAEAQREPEVLNP